MKLIDKNKLLEELKELKQNLSASPIVVIEDVESLVESLEVKDVDLEKESELIANEIMIGVQANKYHTNIYNTERNDFNHSHLWLAARKGIELGINAQKGE